MKYISARWKKRASLILIGFLICGGPLEKILAEFRENEAVMNPAGFPTTDVLKKSEKLFAPHGWAGYGFTSKITGTIDWLATTFGVPSGVVRYQINGVGKVTHAVEVYGLFATRTVKSNRDQDYNLVLKGASGWMHVIQTTKLTSTNRLHLYAGFSYMNFMGYEPKEHLFPANYHSRIWTPDMGVAIEHTVNRALKLNLNTYYGNSFYYYDQDARKYVVTYGLYWTPFSSRHHPFWANMRLEINGFYAYIPYAQYHFATIPFFPILTWRW